MSDDPYAAAQEANAAVVGGDIVEPQFEYDEPPVELTGDEDLSAASPDSPANELMNDDDFEKVLGNAHQIVHAQEVVDTEFADIAKSGVLQVAGDDVGGRRVVLFSACKLPPNTANGGHDRLLRYVKATLDTLVSEEYAIVYLHHGMTRENRPSFSWLRKAYQELDRKYKKNLKALYIVHPSGWIRLVWTFVKPFVSSKFTKKVIYVNYLSDLASFVDMSHLQVPQIVRTYDQGLEKSRAAKAGSANAANSTKLDPAAYVNLYAPRQAGAPTLQQIKMANGGRVIPPVVEDTVAYVRRHGLEVEGVFRLSPALSDVRVVQACYQRGERVDFATFNNSVILAAGSLKSFLRELGEPLCTFEMFDEAVRIGTSCDAPGAANAAAISPQLMAARELVCDKLPDENYEVLQFLCIFLHEVAENSAKNLMTASNLSIVFGPNLVWSRTQAQSLTLVRPINAFVQLLITEANDIFVKSGSFA